MVGSQWRPPFVIGVIFALALQGAIAGVIDDTPPARSPGVSDAPPGLSEGWYARIVTSKGDILVRLLPDQAPNSVAHFAALAEGRLAWVDPRTGAERTDPYYDGLLIHKAVAGQRFETGDPTGTGHGAPPIYVPREGIAPVNFHRPLRVGMTITSTGWISGALFFVTASALPELTGRHPCFGEVVSGTDVVWDITTVKTDSAGKPLEPVVIESIRVLKAGDPDPLPEPVPYRPHRKQFGPKKKVSAAPRPS